MATKIDNEFQTYELDDKEFLSGRILTSTNIMVLQNLLAEYAQAKLRMKFDPLNPSDFIQQEAENAGWRNCINHILSEHEATMNSIQAELTETTQQSYNDTSAIFEQ